LITYGEKGAECFYNGNRYRQAAFLEENVIDTTGAGDAFFACCLSYVLESDFNNLDSNSINRMLVFANVVASFVISKRGALLAMPSMDDLCDCKSKAQQQSLDFL
jgi:fructokinase